MTGQVIAADSMNLAELAINKSDDQSLRDLNIFISYSRIDLGFADLLAERLNEIGFNAFVDREAILPGEPWKERLEMLIRSADMVIFVLSPEAVASEHCTWEVERTRQLGKIIAPILFRPINSQLAPDGISILNFVPANELGGMAASLVDAELCLRREIATGGNVAEARHARNKQAESFAASALHHPQFHQVAEAISQISEMPRLMWAREHTGWIERAAAWGDARDASLPTSKDMLMRSGEAAVVRNLIERCPEGVNVGDILLQFVTASEAREAEDNRRKMVLVQRAFVEPTERRFAAKDAAGALRRIVAGLVLSQDPFLDLDDAIPPPAHACTVAGRGCGRIVSAVRYHPTSRCGDFRGSSFCRNSYGKLRFAWKASGRLQRVRAASPRFRS